MPKTGKLTYFIEEKTTIERGEYIYLLKVFSRGVYPISLVVVYATRSMAYVTTVEYRFAVFVYTGRPGEPIYKDDKITLPSVTGDYTILRAALGLMFPEEIGLEDVD